MKNGESEMLNETTILVDAFVAWADDAGKGELVLSKNQCVHISAEINKLRANQQPPAENTQPDKEDEITKLKRRAGLYPPGF